MFTGIVEEIGNIVDILRGDKMFSLKISCKKVLKDLKIGDSIAVNGICLTVTSFRDNWFISNVMPETIKRTNLKYLVLNQKVNLERALGVSGRLGGHIVSGHIDGTGVIANIEIDKNAAVLTVEAAESILKYIIEKGSVGLDGVSLTVFYVDDKCFKVSLIPLTRKDTTLNMKNVNDIVNIECDIIGKYIEKLIYPKKEAFRKNITKDILAANGFL